MQYNVAQLLLEPTGATRSFSVERAHEGLSGTSQGVQNAQGTVHMLRTHQGILVHAMLDVETSLDCSRCLSGYHRASFIDIEEEFIPQVDPHTGRNLADEFDDGVDFVEHVKDGTRARAGQTIATLEGSARTLLTAERTALNLLGRLCGIATLTSRYCSEVAGTKARIYDTRKTTPGWRTLDKYAVRCGGGGNHRMGLFDAVLIKDNHLAGIEKKHLAQGVFDLLNRLDRSAKRPSFVEVEAEDLESVEQLLKVIGVELILLDNFTPSQCRDAVSLRDAEGLRDRVILEASGGMTLENVRAYAESGVERISVGCLTHSFKSIDMKLERIEC
ncbi:MAG: carboxylating nicotinate-nucleotide diphosphorylase [Planctomycetes bacterium]|nr:carboxylating nicotinate-nucleotide diphosphorylase [Planctomycetota bacterium]